MMIMKMIASGMPENQSALVPNLMLATPLTGGNRWRFSFPRKGRRILGR
jgi:hypothetical protein